MISRRKFLVASSATLAAAALPSYDPIIKGIRFISSHGKTIPEFAHAYNKTAYYTGEKYFWSKFTYWEDEGIQEARLSVYKEAIELQKRLGYDEWEIIT